MPAIVGILPFFFLFQTCWRLWWPDDSALTMGMQVSLGSSPDLTQDAELPLGLFFFFFSNLPSPSLCLLFEFLTSCPLSRPQWWIRGGRRIPAETLMEVRDTAVVTALMKMMMIKRRRFHSSHMKFPSDSFADASSVCRVLLHVRY